MGSVGNLQKALVLLWFVLCTFLFVVLLHPSDLQSALPTFEERIQCLHIAIRPFFFRPLTLKVSHHHEARTDS
jgi:hypothetical protein